MYYSIRKQLTETDPNNISKDPFVAVLSSVEAANSKLPDGFDAVMIPKHESARFCKAEAIHETICGTFFIPGRRSAEKRTTFSYCIKKDGVIFVDDSDFVSHIVKKIASSISWKQPTVGHFFHSFLDLLIEGDLKLLEKIENYLSNLETSVLNDNLENFNHKIITIRKEILSSAHYYSQLADIAHEFMQDDNDIFDGSEKKIFDLFYDRALRLRSETQMLREYSGQISEIYQAQIDIYQNKVMKILTIVTTIFLPLSLLAGWYGMNFKYMPELQWIYGYPFALFISLMIVIYCLWIFKKYKYW